MSSGHPKNIAQLTSDCFFQIGVMKLNIYLCGCNGYCPVNSTVNFVINAPLPESLIYQVFLPSGCNGDRLPIVCSYSHKNLKARKTNFFLSPDQFVFCLIELDLHFPCGTKTALQVRIYRLRLGLQPLCLETGCFSLKWQCWLVTRSKPASQSFLFHSRCQ